MLLWLEAWRVSRRFPIALSGPSITNGKCYLQDGRWSRRAVYKLFSWASPYSESLAFNLDTYKNP